MPLLFGLGFFTPQPLRAVGSIVFTHVVQMGGWRETIRCRKFILSRDFG